jgi:hypothetical protein
MGLRTIVVARLARENARAGGAPATRRDGVARTTSASTLLHLVYPAASLDERTVELAGALKQQVREAATGFTGGQRWLETLGGAIRVLREFSSLAPSAKSSDARRMAVNYTMQSERSVHQSLYRPEAAPPAGPEPEMAAAVQEDNVEFF